MNKKKKLRISRTNVEIAVMRSGFVEEQVKFCFLCHVSESIRNRNSFWKSRLLLANLKQTDIKVFINIISYTENTKRSLF